MWEGACQFKLRTLDFSFCIKVTEFFEGFKIESVRAVPREVEDQNVSAGENVLYCAILHATNIRILHNKYGRDV
jgi:hypothetical protein